MPLIYVTGISGAGKSAACDELRRRGYVAFDADRDGFKSWYDRFSDEWADEQRSWDEATVEWRRRFWLKIDPHKVERLAEEARGRPEPTFLCGTSAGEDAVWHLFSRVIQLSISEETLRRRIDARTENDFGKDPADLSDILVWHEAADERMVSFGAILVDAEQPLDAVVDEVVSAALHP